MNNCMKLKVEKKLKAEKATLKACRRSKFRLESNEFRFQFGFILKFSIGCFSKPVHSLDFLGSKRDFSRVTATDTKIAMLGTTRWQSVKLWNGRYNEIRNRKCKACVRTTRSCSDSDSARTSLSRESENLVQIC